MIDRARSPRLLLFAAALLTAGLAGCTGIPADAAAIGDRITGQVTITDAATGEVLIDGQSVNFIIGSGTSGFGFDFERASMGLRSGDDATWTTAGPMLRFTGELEADDHFEPVPLQQEVEASIIEQNLGPAVVGAIYRPEFSFYGYSIDAVEGGMATYSIIVEDGQRDEVPAFGATLVTRLIGGGQMQQFLEPVIGATFAIQQNPFQPETPLGLAPGSYKMLRHSEGTLHLAYAPTPFHSIVDKTLTVRFQVHDVTPGPPGDPGPVDGNYGVRTSPVVNGGVDPEPSFEPFMAMPSAHDDEHDDGHGH